MRIYEENGKWKVGKDGELKYSTREEAKNAYLDGKLKELQKALTKIARKRSN